MPLKDLFGFASLVTSLYLSFFTGTAIVLLSFPFLFSPCYLCSAAPSQKLWLQPLYYGILITAFQVGWATVQIAHLSLIPDLSPRTDDRNELTAVRYMASVCSSLTLYLITWLAFHAARGGANTKIGPEDAYTFRVSWCTNRTCFLLP